MNFPPCEDQTPEELIDALRDENLRLRLAASTVLGILRRTLEIDEGAETRARENIEWSEGGYAAAFGAMIASRRYLRDNAKTAVDRLARSADDLVR